MKKLLAILAMFLLIGCAGKPLVLVLDGSCQKYTVDYAQVTEDVEPALVGM